MHQETKEGGMACAVIWQPGEDIMATFRRWNGLAPADHSGCVFVDLSLAAPNKRRSLAPVYELKRVAGNSPGLPKRIMAIPVADDPSQFEATAGEAAILIHAVG